MKRKLLFVAMTVVMLGLLACGGGGSDIPIVQAPTPTPVGTDFYLGKYTSLTTGDSYSINFSGSDSTGATYTGTQQSTVVGPTTFENRSVIQRNMVMNLTKVGVGVILATTTQIYYNTDRTLYKMVFSNGVTATPTSTFPLPITVQIGSFAGQSLSYSNGNSLTQTWQVTDAGNYVANIIVSSTTNLGLSEVDTITLTSTGTITGIKQIIYGFPTAGVNTTLNGTMI